MFSKRIFVVWNWTCTINRCYACPIVHSTKTVHPLNHSRKTFFDVLLLSISQKTCCTQLRIDIHCRIFLSLFNEFTSTVSGCPLPNSDRQVYAQLLSLSHWHQLVSWLVFILLFVLLLTCDLNKLVALSLHFLPVR